MSSDSLQNTVIAFCKQFQDIQNSELETNTLLQEKFEDDQAIMSPKIMFTKSTLNFWERDCLDLFIPSRHRKYSEI